MFLSHIHALSPSSMDILGEEFFFKSFQCQANLYQVLELCLDLFSTQELKIEAKENIAKMFHRMYTFIRML